MSRSQSSGPARTTWVEPSPSANCHLRRQMTGMSSGRAGRTVTGAGSEVDTKPGDMAEGAMPPFRGGSSHAPDPPTSPCRHARTALLKNSCVAMRSLGEHGANSVDDVLDGERSQEHA